VTDSATYLSALAALVGTFVGGITSIATSWLGQQRQTKELRRARAKAEMQALYKQFILEASKLYTDALEHDTAANHAEYDAPDDDVTWFRPAV
jgi:gas vesicle protein